MQRSDIRAHLGIILLTGLLSSLGPGASRLAAQGDEGAAAGLITGVVWDSISGAPLADAAVFLWDTPYRGVSGPDGHFRVEGVPDGEYSLLFFHTRLGEMGVSAGPVTLVVEAGRPIDVALGTPSRATLARTQCLLEETRPEAGILAGRVYDGGSDVPLGGALVTVSWEDDESSRANSSYVRTGADGRFRMCDTPSDRAVLLGVDYVGRQSRRREVRVDAGGFMETELPLYSLAASHLTGQLVDASTGEPVEGAETWLRGTGLRTLSDGGGHFEFDDVPPGTYMLMTDHLAYGTKMDTLVVPTGQRLAVEMQLDTRAIPIAPLTVTAEAPPVTIDRRRGGIVITRSEIDEVRQRSRDASDILRSLHVPGILVRHQSNGVICVGYSTGQVKMNQTGCVEMMIYINDVRATDPDLALRLPPESIERMVIYKPVEAGNLFGLGGGNGVWAIYTRGN